jgi:uncharacterized protein YueI
MTLIKNIVYIILGMAIVLFYWKGCNPCPEINDTKTETIYIPGEFVVKIDSTWYNKYYELLDKIPEEKPLYSGTIPKRILKKLKRDSVKGSNNDIKRYTTFFSDSTTQYIINGKVTYLSKGIVLSTDINYDIKSLVVLDKSFRVDTITILETNHIVKNHLWIGAETSVSPFAKHISAKIFFMHKKGWSIGYRYENNFNYSNTHNIGLSKVIF